MKKSRSKPVPRIKPTVTASEPFIMHSREVAKSFHGYDTDPEILLACMVVSGAYDKETSEEYWLDMEGLEHRGYLLLNPIRRLLQDPSSTLMPYLREGMTVLEPGPGMGFFTLELARRVGPTGRVIAVDVQPKMIERLKRRAANANLADRIDARVTRPDSMQLDGLECRVDFILAFAVGTRNAGRGSFLPPSRFGYEAGRSAATGGTSRPSE
jgi:SAM-dependent methyltransferase